MTGGEKRCISVSNSKRGRGRTNLAAHVKHASALGGGGEFQPGSQSELLLLRMVKCCVSQICSVLVSQPAWPHELSFSKGHDERKINAALILYGKHEATARIWLA